MLPKGFCKVYVIPVLTLIMKKIFIVTIIVCVASFAKSQDITGKLKDAADLTPIENVTVQLLTKDSAASSFFTVTNNKGEFTLRKIPSGNYILKFSSIGYGIHYEAAKVKESGLDLATIEFLKSAETLSEVFVDATPPVVQKGDTTVYSASKFKVNPDASSEDLIKKMPGVTVDGSGAVTAHGETVKKVTVDGRDFFGDDATATLRNLPAEIVDKIEVFDKLSDQAQLTGFDDGNTTKSINIITKKDMRAGNFGRIYGGYGTDDRYNAGGNVSFFNNARRITILGLTNNVNQQNFASDDLLGAMSGGNRGGGGRRGGGDNFMVGQQSGISKTNAIGLNYNDEWGKKVEVSGSYFFNKRNASNNQTINRQNFISEDTTQYYDENNISQNENFNHRFNLRLKYTIDSSNSLLVTSGLSFQNNNAMNLVEGVNSFENDILLSATHYDINRRSWGNNLNNSVLFRHAFPKKGRSISVDFSTSFSSNNGEDYVNSANTYYKSVIQNDTTQRYTDQNRNTNRYSVNLVYTEPLSEKTQLQVNYNPVVQISKADQQTFDFDDGSGKFSSRDSTLSNVFDNIYNTHNAGITVRRGDWRKSMVSLGVSYQHSELNSDQKFPVTTKIRQEYSNFLGNAFARFKLSSKTNLRFSYRSSVNAPSVNQLQNVINTSNQLFFTTGNPDLDQQYTHSVMGRFNYNNTVTNRNFFANIYVSTINNYVSNATYTASKDSVLSNTVTLHKGSQLSKPVNLDGYMNARSFFTFSTPLKFMKSNMNFNAGISYAKQPGLLNGKLNTSNAWNYNLGAVLSSNISEYVDFNLSYSANINDVENTIRPQLNNNYFTQSVGLTANLLTKKGTFFQNNVSNQSYQGLTDGYNQSYWLWNMAIGQKFLKNQKGELKLSVFDLLKQNKSITRDVTEAYVQDKQSEVLQQYFMLTFTYKLKTFGKGKATSNGERSRMFRGPYGREHE